jgi:YD repeat-containing protein
VTASFTYDNAGRLLTRSYPSAAETVTFTYDQVTSGNKGKGRLTGVQDAAGTTSLTYDAKGRVTAEVRTIGARSYAVAYGYAANGDRLVAVTYPSGRIVTYGHDAQGRIVTVGLKRSGTGPEEPVVTAAGHRPFAGVGSISFGNGLTQSWTFDREERVSGLVLSGPGGVVLTDRTYAVGDGLNLTGVTEGLAPGESQALAYDHTGRLATASGAYGSFAWSYDLVGNRLTESLASGGATVSRIYAYPAASNRLAGVSG